MVLLALLPLPQMHAIIMGERNRQRTGLEMIASENFTSRAVMEVNGRAFQSIPIPFSAQLQHFWEILKPGFGPSGSS